MNPKSCLFIYNKEYHSDQAYRVDLQKFYRLEHLQGF